MPLSARAGSTADEPEGPIRYASAIPNDPAWLQLRQDSYFQTIKMPAAWDVTTGDDGLILAILDSGIRSTHADLRDRLLPGYDFVNNDPIPEDDCGHGTQVAGAAAASTNSAPALGVAGATWRGKILPVKVMRASGSSCVTTSDRQIALAIDFAVSRGASVVNLSLGGEDPPTAELNAAIARAIQAGVVVIAAAGNEGSTIPHYPAASPGVIAVGSTNAAGRRSAFSNNGGWVHLYAPGESIATTMSTGDTAFGTATGTSFASPLVAGVALLMKAANPRSNGITIAQQLKATAVGGLVDAAAAVRASAMTFTSASATGSGYWMLGQQGAVYSFGGAGRFGSPAVTGATAADLEPTPSGTGYWVVDSVGHVFAFGTAGYFGGAGALLPGEQVTSLSTTPNGDGYWIFTTRGRVFNRGRAPHLGDFSATVLNGAILDSIPTPTGEGYFMVGSDGGVFAFGNAKFKGSMGATRLNAPVQSLVPDPDGSGYWLVASDGGVFAFDAPFRGSMGGVRLNAPVTGMVPYGNGYVMVATDGGAFVFSDQPFSGSLAGTGAQPVVAIAAKSAG